MLQRRHRYGLRQFATFSRGAPVSRFTNKLFIIEHKDLLAPVAVVGAGMTAFIDKFLDRAKREGIGIAAAEIKRKLDVVDFVERVCETVVTLLVKEYAIDRNRFFGGPVSDFSLSMLVAGATSADHGPAELRSYNIHSVGLAEFIDGYGTIGSGAPYAELFLHGLVPEPNKTSVKDAIGLVCHAIKGVEIMDPNVGGDTRVCALKLDDKGKLSVTRQSEKGLPKGAKDRMEGVLKKMSTDMRKVVK